MVISIILILDYKLCKAAAAAVSKSSKIVKNLTFYMDFLQIFFCA